MLIKSSVVLIYQDVLENICYLAVIKGYLIAAYFIEEQLLVASSEMKKKQH